MLGQRIVGARPQPFARILLYAALAVGIRAALGTAQENANMNLTNTMAKAMMNETTTGGPFGSDELLSLVGMMMAMIVGIGLMSQAANAFVQ
jgi:hypothetical protein